MFSRCHTILVICGPEIVETDELRNRGFPHFAVGTVELITHPRLNISYDKLRIPHVLFFPTQIPQAVQIPTEIPQSAHPHTPCFCGCTFALCTQF